VREVPLPPQLVARLQTHLERWAVNDGHVFTTTSGTCPTTTNYNPVWTRAKRDVWPEGHPLAATTVYGLRHAAATMMLRAGVMPAEVGPTPRALRGCAHARLRRRARG
jgi:integrase